MMSVMIAFLFDVNGYAFFALFMIYIMMERGMDTYAQSEQCFGRTLVLSMVALVSDYLASRCTGVLPGAIVRGAMLVNYLCFPLMFTQLVRWFSQQIEEPEENLRGFVRVVDFFCLIDLSFIIATQTQGFYYHYDEFGYYHRGPLFMVNLLLMFVNLILIDIMVLVHHKRLRHHNFLALIFFSMPSIAAVCFSTFGEGYSYESAGVSFSLLSIFINVQSQIIEFDSSTRVSSRQRIDILIKKRIRDTMPGMMFAVIVVNLESYTGILHHFDRTAGESAMKMVAGLLRQNIGQHDILGKYTDHSLAIIVDSVRDTDVLMNMTRGIEHAVEQANKAMDIPYELQVKVGCDIFAPELQMDAETFMKRLDQHIQA